METIYISVAAKGTMESLNSTARGRDEVVLSFYGPKGGTRACEALTLESAATLRDALAVKLPVDHASDTVDALTQAESFIRGFEDDPLQEGIADMLAGLRAAIPREQARPDMLAALKTILEGCEVDGRWLDASGTECGEGDEGARWQQFDGEEQDRWIASVAEIARNIIAKAEPPAPSTAATNRPGDQAAVYAQETGVDYATALVHCNMD